MRRGSRRTVRGFVCCALVCVLGRGGNAGSCSTFRRGDSTGDGRVDLSDAVFTLNYLFRGGAEPGCLDAADANDDGGVNLSDPIFTLNYLFRAGPRPSEPGLDCGGDPTADALDCRLSLLCSPCRQPASDNVAPQIEIVRPRDGERVNSIDRVTVAFERTANGHATGFVRRIELLVGGRVVDVFDNEDRVSAGEHTFDNVRFDRADTEDGSVCVTARVYKASPRAMLCRDAESVQVRRRRND